MHTAKFGIIRELKEQVKRLLIIKAEGEPTTGEPKVEPQPSASEPSSNPTPSPVNFEDLISKARNEEKAKLYPKIKKLEEEKNVLVEDKNTLMLKVGQLETDIDTYKKQLESTGKSEDEVVKGLKKTITSLEKKLAEIESNTVDVSTLEQEIRTQVEAEYDVKMYRLEKVGELKDNLLPELVMGTTREEIDNSIEQSKARFEEIRNRVLGGVSIPPVNTSSSKFTSRDFSIEDFAKLDPRSTEYAEMRKKLGLK